ncbi:hypothetical protein [Enorma massiliensis]|uniref:hypothetical protein n=1 Tax=Enorma massiliensis TaxID=1472761 RepID=UPI0023F1E35B|nr:hypothetical protein [Enorma massiliensis]
MSDYVCRLEEAIDCVIETIDRVIDQNARESRMSDYVCRVEEALDRVIDQNARERKNHRMMRRINEYQEMSRALSGDIGAMMLFLDREEERAGLDYDPDQMADKKEEMHVMNESFVKTILVLLCSEREKYLSDGKDEVLRGRLSDEELIEALNNMCAQIGMKSFFGISTREEYLEWIEGERELDLSSV